MDAAFTPGYRAGFDGKPTAPPADDIEASAYQCGYRIGKQAARELGTRIADLARASREAAADFNGSRRDIEHMKDRLIEARSLLTRIEHLFAL
jgi:hypothetical protein